ncbi:MAG: formylglycine-generating enzyme family protein [Deltaproteobacteria bacterium]|nr:formylglycine-generating enzyme family protein [Deltaproteobacteria bacterium]
MKSKLNRSGTASWLALLALAAMPLSCNFLVRVEDGCARDEECPSGQVCNVRRRFCALPVVEQCNGIDDDADGVSDEMQDFGSCQPEVGMGMCGGRRVCRRANGRWALTCELAPAEQEDVCFNGVDDNCNGVVDDGSECNVNFAPTRGLTIGSNDPTTGEGDDAPAHQVCLDRFTLDRYEVTQAQYAVFLSSLAQENVRIDRPTNVMNSTVTYGRYVIYRNRVGDDVNLMYQPNRPGPTQLKRGDGYWVPWSDETKMMPALGVTWLGAAMYCDWAGKHLPTEAEYFRAARGDRGTRLYPWGDEAPTCERANIGINGPNGGPCTGGPMAVNTLDRGASVDGRVFHLFGNANEWMFDWLDTNPTHTENRYYQSLSPASTSVDGGFGTSAWCTTYPTGPLGPDAGSPISQPEGAGQYCRNCRFARGRHYRTVDLRIGIRRWLDPDRSDETVGFRCSRGGTPRAGLPR